METNIIINPTSNQKLHTFQMMSLLKEKLLIIIMQVHILTLAKI